MISIGLLLIGLITGTRFEGGPLPWPVETRLFGLDQTQSWSFGQDVDLDGFTAIVGADMADIGGNSNQGAAYVFVLEGGEWIQQARLVASDGAAEAWFGRSVAIDGDTAVVGTPQAEIDGEIRQGAVYVFRRSGSTWVEDQKLIASDGDEMDRLGWSVDLQSDTVVAGALIAAGGGLDGCEETGAAYVFERVEGTWSEAAKLFDPEGSCSDLFGNAVSVDDESITVGARNAFVGTPSNRGAAYVFVRVGQTWSFQQRVLPWGPEPESFGSAVALDGDSLLVGCQNEHVEGNVRQGAGYLFRRTGSTWVAEQRITASDGQPDGLFGIGVALRGGVALVGAELDLPGDPQRGVVYEYRYDEGAWNEIQRWAAPIGQGLDSFGRAIALTAQHVLISNKDNIVVSPPGGTAWIFGRPVLFADGFESGDASAWTQLVQ